MTWEEAFKKAVQSYFADEQNDLATHKLKPPKYGKKYLDDLEVERFGKKEFENSKPDLPDSMEKPKEKPKAKPVNGDKAGQTPTPYKGTK